MSNNAFPISKFSLQPPYSAMHAIACPPPSYLEARKSLCTLHTVSGDSIKLLAVHKGSPSTASDPKYLESWVEKPPSKR